MHEVDRGVYYDRYVYYDMGMLAWHAAVQRYPRLAIGRLGGSRAREGFWTACQPRWLRVHAAGKGLRSMQHHYGTGGRHDRGDAPAGIWTLNPVLSAAMAGVLVAGANVSRRACVLERAHRQEAVDGVQLCCLWAGALQAGESAGRYPGPVRHPGLGYMRWVRQQ